MFDSMSEITAVPGRDVAAYLTAYTREMGFGDEDPAVVLDRYHTADIEWVNDGVLLDRDRLIAHAHPARKNARDLRLDIHETLTAQDRVAARYTLYATGRKDRAVKMEIYMFGHLAPDGRLRRIDQITRTVLEPGAAD
jgi:SnoaL-like protein